MRKLIIAMLIAGTMTLFCGCKIKNPFKHPYTSSQAEELMERSYGVDFEYDSFEEIDSPSDYKAYRYIFKDENGRECCFDATMEYDSAVFLYAGYYRESCCDYYAQLAVLAQDEINELCKESGLEFECNAPEWNIYVTDEKDIPKAAKLVHDMVSCVKLPDDSLPQFNTIYDDRTTHEGNNLCWKHGKITLYCGAEGDEVYTRTFQFAVDEEQLEDYLSKYIHWD